MRLHHLEISGFKSFPERARLAFDDGVTAIVGPNGCGKSNLIDAITWVLGEQSARSLRGERMDDIIFGGSDARKPIGTAEVRLLLKQVTAPAPRGRAGGNGHSAAGPTVHGGPDGNGHGVGRIDAPRASDDDAAGPDEPPIIARDVEVGRRLYRSGESEYLIDGQVCRLRDIQDLLMDAGVGVKAYAVIEQGRIGQILSARPTERRQLIEEAAGVTKYKSRRRAAELKLEAAQQNLTRIDDIVYEVEKQRVALKRQAAKARRYRRLRDELRRWEKVLFARRYDTLRETVAAVRQRLDAARAREHGAAARLAAREGDQERLRIELTETEARATAARDAAHSRELELTQRQQHIEFDRQQLAALAEALKNGEVELAELQARREPERLELDRQRAAAEACRGAREAATARLAAAEAAFTTAHRAIEGLEADVEAARSEVFAAINAATTLRHVVEHAAAGRSRLAAELARLDAETADLALEASRAAADSQAAEESIRIARDALAAIAQTRTEREADLATARIEREWRARDLRAREHEVAATAARLASLEELEAARAEYSDAARFVLAEADGQIAHLGSVADHLDVEHPYERALEAGLGDLLQHVVVRSRADAEHGLRLVRERNAGRCGFLVLDAASTASAAAAPSASPLAGLTPLADLVRVSGPGAAAVGAVLARRWIAESLEAAAAAALVTSDPIATPDGEVWRGAMVLQGGSREAARGLLGTRREIRDLRARLQGEEASLRGLADELAGFDAAAARATDALEALQGEQHRHEKATVGWELQLARIDEERGRLARKQELVAVERRRAQEERDALDAKDAEAREAITRLEAEQRAADDRLTQAQRRLIDAREAVDALGGHVAEAKAADAALAERAAALAADVRRVQQAADELEARVSARADDLDRLAARRATVLAAIAETERRLDADVAAFTELREAVRLADERALELRTAVDAEEARVREARADLEELRSQVGQLEVSRATAEADLSHLAETCQEALQLSLTAVRAEVGQLEYPGSGGDAALLVASDVVDEDGLDEDRAPHDAAADMAEPASAHAALTAEEAIARLRAKIDRLGPVNMMAIDQFDELEQRYEFLTAQRTDLLDSIAATGEAIKRIDRTTRERFRDAFTSISVHFQETFSTLFGGGHAGLVLLDETDLLESGIDIIAQPPGKRLQNVQLLSGGEKALTAMALMFAIFQYRPSPFCLLDEIDAPLDDANIGRFLQMLRGMLSHTQFILVTHNRKTMEIANRLYGVTMEEPGVSKLISVQLN